MDLRKELAMQLQSFRPVFPRACLLGACSALSAPTWLFQDLQQPACVSKQYSYSERDGSWPGETLGWTRARQASVSANP